MYAPKTGARHIVGSNSCWFFRLFYAVSSCVFGNGHVVMIRTPQSVKGAFVLEMSQKAPLRQPLIDKYMSTRTC